MGMGKGRYLAPLLYHQPGHGLSVLQIGGRGIWLLVGLMCSLNKESCKVLFATGTANWIAGPDSKVFISKSLSVLQMLYILECWTSPFGYFLDISKLAGPTLN